MTKQKMLKGKVAEILGEYTIAINIGKNEGVQPGMVFAVRGKHSIKDPDSRQTLGEYEYDKTHVRVEKVEDSYSTASTIKQQIYSGTVIGIKIPEIKRDRVVPDEKSIGVSRRVFIGDSVEERKTST